MSENTEVIKVGISDYKVVKTPLTIRTSGLGSCVGVVIYDQSIQVAGMAHIMLPSSTLAKVSGISLGKYADTAIRELIQELRKLGVRNHLLKAKIAGGSQMFQFTSNNDTMRIGPRNVEAVKLELQGYRIPIISEDVGGNSGRTIEFDPSTCLLEVRTVKKGVQYI